MSERAAELARRALRHLKAETTDRSAHPMVLPVAAYSDPERFRREFAAIFLRKPQALLLGIEIPESGDYVARSIMTKPLLFVRGKDGVARVFLNVCRHRGARVCAEGKGRVRGFVCPYHSWAYSDTGRLTGVKDRSKFGDIENLPNGLTELCSVERYGVIWATLESGIAFNLDEWLGGAARELADLDLGNWHLFDQRSLPGPGWKVTMDGYLEAYHHDTVHAKTLAKHTIGNLLVHDVWGHHQMLTMGRLNLAELESVPEADWNAMNHIRTILAIFPNFQVSGIRGGHCLVSQIFPGPTPERSDTIQSILSARQPSTPQEQAESEAFSALCREAVGNEDYPIGFGVQAGLHSGANSHFLIGRNEPGIQHYHRTVALLADG